MNQAFQEYLATTVQTLRERMPDGMAVDTWLEGSDFEELGGHALDPLQHEDIAYLTGLLSGAAAALDMTVVQMLDDFGVEISP